MTRASHSFLLLLATSLVAACGPSAPSETEARAWFEADGDAIRVFDEGVRQHITENGLLDTVALEDPQLHEKEALTRRARSTFREIGLPDFTRQAGAIRAEIHLLDGDTDTGSLALAGAPAPVRGSGNTEAEHGVEVSGRKLGWGVYGIENADGVIEQVRGYEVRWEAELEGRRLSMRLFMPAH